MSGLRLLASPTRPPLMAQRALMRYPSSYAKSFSACSGSMTAWSPLGTCASAPRGVAFRPARRRRRSKLLISRLNGRPAASPVNASAAPSRAPPHDSGSGWFAIPFLYLTFIDYSLPVSWRTVLSPLPRRSDWGCSLLDSPAISVFPEWVIGSTCAMTLSRIAQCSHYITACTLVGSPYVTRHTRGFSHFVTSMTAPVTSGWSISPGGIRTHWKTPPYHGAHPLRPFVMFLRLLMLAIVPC